MISCSKRTFKLTGEKRMTKKMIALRIAPISFAALLAVLGFGASAHAVDLAKVNGRVITDRDLNLALGNLNEGQRASVLKDSSSRRQVLLSVVDQEILVQQAEKEKLDADADFKEAAAAFRRQYLTKSIRCPVPWQQKKLGNSQTRRQAQKASSLASLNPGKVINP
jgi:hypothetical protein